MEHAHFDESIVAELEQTVVAAMDEPTDRKTSMQYAARITDEYSIDVELMTYTPNAQPYGVSGSSHRLFLHHDVPEIRSKVIGVPELGEERCERPVLFSAIYDNDEDGRSLHGLSGKVKLPMADIITLRPQDRELAIMAGNLALQLSQGDFFEVQEKDPEWDEQLIQNFLRITSLAAASGVYIDTSYRAAQVDELELFASYVTFSGDPRFMTQSELEYPYLRFSAVKDEIETVYERSLSGRVDVKTRLANPDLRYASLPSFKSIYDDEGEPMGCTFDHRELEALEDEEREKGLFVPTREQVAELTSYAHMFTTRDIQ
jgi:hypothetical protein